MFSERAEILKTFDHQEIFFRCFTPKTEAEKPAHFAGIVIGVHGFAEHSGRYAHVAEHICKRGYAFVNFDLRGHGSSGERRGDIADYRTLVLDVLYILNQVTNILQISSNRKLKIGLLGHSYGGLISTYAAAVLGTKCPPLFLSAPCYLVKQKIPAWKKLAGDLMPYVAPGLMIPLDMDYSVISENVDNNNAYENDSLVLHKISTRMAKTFMESLEETSVEHAMSLVTAPVTIACGARDRLVDSDYTKKNIVRFGSEKREFHEIAGAGHEIFNEQDVLRKVAFRHLDEWMDFLDTYEA